MIFQIQQSTFPNYALTVVSVIYMFGGTNFLFFSNKKVNIKVTRVNWGIQKTTFYNNGFHQFGEIQPPGSSVQLIVSWFFNKFVFKKEGCVKTTKSLATELPLADSNIDEGLAHCFLRGKSGSPPVFVNGLLEHSGTGSFTYCPWLLLFNNNSRVGVTETVRPEKPKIWKVCRFLICAV